jgi:hypothetical protein
MITGGGFGAHSDEGDGLHHLREIISGKLDEQRVATHIKRFGNSFATFWAQWDMSIGVGEGEGEEEPDHARTAWWSCNDGRLCNG